MSGIPLISTLVPQNNGPFPTHDAQYGRGGLVSVTSVDLMEAITTQRRVAGMVAVVSTTQSMYILNQDLVTWDAVPSSDFVNPMTAAGDIIVGAAGGSPTRLAVGSNGQILTTVSGAPTWVNPGSNYNPAAVAITGGTLDNVVIGSVSPNTATFTTVSATTFSGGAAITSGTIDGTVIGSVSPAAATVTTLVAHSTISSAAVTINSIATYDAAILNTVSNAPGQIIDSRPIANFRSVRYSISITSGSSYQFTEVYLVHDGTTPYISEINYLPSSSDLANFDCTIAGGNVQLLVTPTNNITTFKVAILAIAA